MARACACCTHPSKDAIDLAIAARQSQRQVAAAFGVSASAVARHSRHAASPTAAPSRSFYAAHLTDDFETGCTDTESGAAPSSSSYRPRSRPARADFLPEAVQRRQARAARDRGLANDEIALRLDVSEAVVAHWQRDDTEADRRAAAAYTPLDRIAVIDRQHRDMLAMLSKATDIASSKGDVRTLLDLVRERRYLTKSWSDHAARCGAYNHIAEGGVPSNEVDEELHLPTLVRLFVRDFGEMVSDIERDRKLAQVGTNGELSHDLRDDDDDGPCAPPVHVTT